MAPKYLRFARSKSVPPTDSRSTSISTVPAAAMMKGTSQKGMVTNGHGHREGFHSKAQDDLLNVVDSLRFEGLDKDLSLPQLVVCGDQSSGKSSVLEAIAEIPFPRKENLCTRFATEIILRRKKVLAMTCKIIPDKSRPSEEQAWLSSQILTIHTTAELPSIIEQATKLMGLEDTIEGKGAFSKDILRIEVESPDQSHLTLVDLPGLIHSENKLQTAADVEIISNLVDKYITNPRTIILPVISAKNDIANQIILKKARAADPDGRRTLGMITKPDDLQPGSDSEKAFISLARNGDISFALGWHVLRNRNAQEMKSSFLEREQKEAQFFANTDWSQLSEDSLGISSLRSRLSVLLYHHIKQELPGLRKELNTAYAKTEVQLTKLGEARATVQQKRQYLTGLSTKFHDLTRSATNGLYHHQYFASKSTAREPAIPRNSNRLCAMVASTGLDFAEVMNKFGHKYVFSSRQFGAPDLQAAKIGNEDVIINQVTLSPNESMTLIKRVLADNRGTELPGSFNPNLIGELYRTQSQNWKELSLHRISQVADLCSAFCKALRNEIAPRRISNGYLDDIIDEALSRRTAAAREELQKILEDEECPPLTFNHYYTLTIQKSRSHKRKRETAPNLDSTASTPVNDKRQKIGVQTPRFGMPGAMLGSSSSTESMAASHVQTAVATAVESDQDEIIFEDGEIEAKTRTILMDMDEHSARDALEALLSYDSSLFMYIPSPVKSLGYEIWTVIWMYKVARKTFIDNVEKQVIRRHLINGLEDIFSPAVVAGWSDEEVTLAATEPKVTTVKRQDLEDRLGRLKKGIEVFKKAERLNA